MTLSIRSDDGGIDPAVVIAYVSQTRTMLNFQFAIVTVLLFDTVLNFDKEVKYFWSSPRKFVSVIYFLNRYVGIFGSISLLPWFSLEANFDLCNFSGWARNIANWVTIVLIDCILMIRVLAFYHSNRRMSIFLKTSIVLAALSRGGVMIYGTLYQGMIVVDLATDASACTYVRIVSRSVGAIDWAIPLVYSIILMALALYKAAEFWRLSNGLTGMKLVKILVLDQFFYFLLAVACFVVNIVLNQVDVANIFLWAAIGSLGSPSFLCLLGSRLLIHLKEAGEVGVNAGTSYRLKTMSVPNSEMSFA